MEDKDLNTISSSIWSSSHANRRRRKVLDAALPHACVPTVQKYARPLQQRRRLSGLRRILRRDLVGLSGIVIGSLALADVGLRSIPSNECHVPCMPRRSIGDLAITQHCAGSPSSQH
jgi:hypothetical protein